MNGNIYLLELRMSENTVQRGHNLQHAAEMQRVLKYTSRRPVAAHSRTSRLLAAWRAR